MKVFIQDSGDLSLTQTPQTTHVGQVGVYQRGAVGPASTLEYEVEQIGLTRDDYTINKAASSAADPRNQNQTILYIKEETPV